MTERHIRTFAAFMLAYHDKNSNRKEEITILVVDGEMEADMRKSELKGVKTADLAKIEGVTQETARRRLRTFQELGVVEEMKESSGKGKSYIPSIEYPEHAFGKVDRADNPD